MGPSGAGLDDVGDLPSGQPAVALLESEIPSAGGMRLLAVSTAAVGCARRGRVRSLERAQGELGDLEVVGDEESRADLIEAAVTVVEEEVGAVGSGPRSIGEDVPR